MSWLDKLTPALTVFLGGAVGGIFLIAVLTK